MELSSLMFLVVGLALGVPMGWLLFRVRSSSNVPENGELKIQLKLEMERSKKLAEELQQMNNELRSEREEVIHLNNQNSTLKANYQNLQTRLEEQKGELGQLQEKFTTEFKNLANEIFEEKSKKFTDQNKTNLHELLSPLGQKLTEFEKKVEQTNKESLERSTALREQIIGLRELNDRMTKEAENLTKALKG
ncbi:MAG: DNA recombination protein RmuC, partial [Ekhidna sp.]